MLRTYTLTGLLALSIAAAPVTAPTAMAKDNFDRLLIGLAAVGIVGAIVHEKNKKKEQKRVVHTTPKHRVHNEHHRHGSVVHRHKHGRGHHKGKHVDVRGGHKHVDAKPRTCLRQRWTNQGWVKFYSKKCLRNHGY